MDDDIDDIQPFFLGFLNSTPSSFFIHPIFPPFFPLLFLLLLILRKAQFFNRTEKIVPLKIKSYKESLKSRRRWVLLGLGLAR